MANRAAAWLRTFSGFYRPEAGGVRPDPVTLFLYSARSVILIISAQAASIAGLLALADRRFDPVAFAFLLVGLVTAHAISNLSNDYFGYKRGHDTPDSPRMRYTIHPVASGLLSGRELLVGIAVLAVVGVAIAVGFTIVRGPIAMAFAVAGALLLFLYDAAPVPLKKLGLGEIAALVVWGPLMVGGGYFVITGEVSLGAMAISLPYGLGVMSILAGKHIDQLQFDTGVGNKTLPVVLGEPAARAVNQGTILAMYAVTIALVLARALTPYSLVVLVALPRGLDAVRRHRLARPDGPPPGYVGWPLWYHRACLTHNRSFGWLYLGGLALGALLR